MRTLGGNGLSMVIRAINDNRKSINITIAVRLTQIKLIAL